MATENIDGLPLAPCAVGAVHAALREARQRGHGFIGTEHLLLGMLSEPGAAATRLLAKLGVVDDIREQLTAVLGTGYSVHTSPASVKDWDLRHELLRRQERDQALRMRPMTMAKGAAGELPPEALKFEDELRRLDQDNTEWLGTVIRMRGWPVRSVVGDDATNAAWLLAQHADHDLAFQRECLSLLEQAVEANEASAAQLAYLTDRVRLGEGRSQLYGTQLRHEWAGGELEPAPIEDPQHVDDRRAAVGLEPLALYLQQSRRVLQDQSERYKRRVTT